MPFVSHRPPLTLNPEMRATLETVATSQTEPYRRVQRARILLGYAAGRTVSALARSLSTYREKVERCLDKARHLGALVALEDLPGRGRKGVMTPEARPWVLDLACQKPKDLGYAAELWTLKLLRDHARNNALETGHICLVRASKSTIQGILKTKGLQPHKIRYYLERRDPDFEAKKIQVLCVYQQVAAILAAGGERVAEGGILSYDEKPGIQAIGTTAPDLPPTSGEHPTVGRDHEYKRRGTVSLMAGIDLLTGQVHGQVTDRHRSREFIAFLKTLDAAYPGGKTLRIILDNHSAHISKETRASLATAPQRFEFIFTPKHGSWLNLIEMFFSKLTRSMLRGIRVGSKEELKRRLLLYLDEVNADPVVFRWSYGLDTLAEG